MNTLLIHQAFASSKDAGGTRHHELARHVVKKGDQFTIIASKLNYLTGKQAVNGECLVERQHIDGINILRTYTCPTLHRSFIWRVISFLSFMITSMFVALKENNVDLVMGTTPPIFQAGSAWLVAKLRRLPFLLEVRDLWPEFAIGLGVLTNPLLIALSRWFELFLYKQATHLLVNSPAYRNYLINKGVPLTKITLIPNGVDAAMFDPKDYGKKIRNKFRLNKKFVVTYAGALGLANDIDTILRAAKKLRNERNIHFLLVGDGKERKRLEIMAKELNLAQVTFTGSYPKSEMKDLLAASDVCLATLKDIPMFRTTYPNKVFDYMAAGRPIILGIDGVIRRVVEEAMAGIFVPPEDGSLLAQAILNLYQNPSLAKSMGTAGRLYVIKNFNRPKQAENFRLLVQALGNEKGHPVSLIYKKFCKRLIDLAFILPALIVLSPLLTVIAIFVRLKFDSPILFRQQRPGLNGQPFTIYKFKTMTDACDLQGNLLPDEKRLTPFGNFLRRSSLDELPELFNILKGNMSLIGPRPLLMAYLERYTQEQDRRHEVKPGITGWAQVNGRNTICWEEKFKLDVWYVDHCSLWLDLKIFALTIWKIFRQEGISQPGHVTMEEFKGLG